MNLTKKVKDAWRKNVPEIVAWWNGSLPDFVTARRPAEALDGVPVFCYHLVEPDAFEADLRFLAKNGYRTVRPGELVGYLNGIAELPERSVLLSFDDGPRNFYDVAFPLLRQYGANALGFIAPALHTRASSADDSNHARPMTWEELETVHASGLVEFHSHTLESRYVPRWPLPVPLAGCAPRIEASRRSSPLPLERDFALSKEEIETRLPGAVADHLSFPMYNGTEVAVKLAQTAGFKACHWGFIKGRALNRRGDSPFYISRISDEFVRRLPGEGRQRFSQLVHERIRRSQKARAWRRTYGELET